MSGNQQWTITAAPGGGFYIQDLIGRGGCDTLNTYLAASACGSDAVGVVAGPDALSTWLITPVAAPPVVPQQPFTQLIPNGQYYLIANGLQGQCANVISYDANCATNNLYTGAGELFYNVTLLSGFPHIKFG